MAVAMTVVMAVVVVVAANLELGEAPKRLLLPLQANGGVAAK